LKNGNTKNSSVEIDDKLWKLESAIAEAKLYVELYSSAEI